MLLPAHIGGLDPALRQRGIPLRGVLGLLHNVQPLLPQERRLEHRILRVADGLLRRAGADDVPPALHRVLGGAAAGLFHAGQGVAPALLGRGGLRADRPGRSDELLLLLLLLLLGTLHVLTFCRRRLHHLTVLHLGVRSAGLMVRLAAAASKALEHGLC